MKHAVVFISFAMAVAVPASVEATPRVPPCAAAGKTVAANSQARVYRSREADEPSGQGGLSYWGCMYGRPYVRYWLGTSVEDFGGPAGFQLVGHLVGQTDGGCDKSSCLSRLFFTSLRTGRFTRVAVYVDEYIADFVLKPNGTMAWTRAKRFPQDASVELRKREAGKESLVDAGSDLDRRSLALAGSSLYWTQAGAARSTTLR